METCLAQNWRTSFRCYFHNYVFKLKIYVADPYRCGALDYCFGWLYDHLITQNKIKLNEMVHQLPTMVVLAVSKSETEVEFTGDLCL